MQEVIVLKPIKDCSTCDWSYCPGGIKDIVTKGSLYCCHPKAIVTLVGKGYPTLVAIQREDEKGCGAAGSNWTPAVDRSPGATLMDADKVGRHIPQPMSNHKLELVREQQLRSPYGRPKRKTYEAPK